MKKYKQDVIVFKASPEIDLPPKYEMFAPTVKQLRGSCVTDFPRTGEYYFAVWAEDGTKGVHHYSMGLGLAERDVMKVSTTIFADYMMVKVYMWNHWSVMGIIWPVILATVLSQVFLIYTLVTPTRTTPTIF